MTAEGPPPTVARRQLGRQLRTLRDKTGKSRADVAATKIMCASKLEQIEYGKVSIKPGDVRELGLLYKADPEVIESMRSLSLCTKDHSFWQEHSDKLPDGFDNFLDLESVAYKTWIFEPLIIHGLVQTPQYALAVEQSSVRPGDEANIDSRVRVRLRRQQRLLNSKKPLQANVILGEAALHLVVGTPEVMRTQYEALLAWDQRDNIDIHILPYTAGPHIAVRGGLVLLDFSDPIYPPISYVESQTGARYTDHLAHVARHREIFDTILSQSVPIKEFTA